MKVVSSAKMSEKHQNDLRNRYPSIRFYFYEEIKEAKGELKTAEVLITYGEDLTEEIIDRSKNLSWIQIISAGIDKIPFESLIEKDILVTNARGIHAIPMSEYIMAVILQIARKTNEIYLSQLNNNWDRSIRVTEINGRTIGIIGLGAIGQEIARIAKAFNMTVLGMNTDGRPVDNIDVVYKQTQLHSLISASDYLVISAPLTKDTYHLIKKEELSSMKKSAYLINIGRGEIIDEEALIEVLKNKKIGGAVLDVFSEEPLPSNHPLWKMDNCIITPHLSGRSPYYMERALEIFKINMRLYNEGKKEDMKNIINLTKGY